MGLSLPFTFTGSSVLTSKISFTYLYVLSLIIISPPFATPSSREDKFTLSPITVYSILSSDPIFSETISPVFTPILIFTFTSPFGV